MKQSGTDNSIQVIQFSKSVIKNLFHKCYFYDIFVFKYIHVWLYACLSAYYFSVAVNRK